MTAQRNSSGGSVWGCADVEVVLGERKTLRGQPVGVKRFVQGDGQVYTVRGAAGWQLEVADVTWRGGERDVRTLNYDAATPASLHRLRQGLRMSVKRHGDTELWVELSQAQPGDDDPAWANLRRASMEQLTVGAGLSVRQAMEALGAEVDLREQLLDDRSRRRGYLCAVFSADGDHLPVICYTITRVLPVLRAGAAAPATAVNDLEGTEGV